MKYTIEQIKAAFIKTFHNAGELWFSGASIEQGDDCNDWTWEWGDFQEKLNSVVNKKEDAK